MSNIECAIVKRGCLLMVQQRNKLFLPSCDKVGLMSEQDSMRYFLGKQFPEATFGRLSEITRYSSIQPGRGIPHVFLKTTLEGELGYTKSHCRWVGNPFTHRLQKRTTQVIFDLYRDDVLSVQ